LTVGQFAKEVLPLTQKEFMFEEIGDQDPQKMFWKESQKRVPEHIERQLTDLLGRDHAGDPVLRVRYDAEKFKEGAWIVEEKIHPSAFGRRKTGTGPAWSTRTASNTTSAHSRNAGSTWPSWFGAITKDTRLSRTRT
jgi:hypothetical protein